VRSGQEAAADRIFGKGTPSAAPAARTPNKCLAPCHLLGPVRGHTGRVLVSVEPRPQRCRRAASLIIIVISNKSILLFKMVLATTDRIIYKRRSVVESVVRLSVRSVWLRRCRNE